VVAIRLSDASVHVFNMLCSNVRTLPTPASCKHSGSGMWSRGGVTVDPDPSMSGRIYVATGNGAFDADRGGTNYGDSVVSLSADARKVLGYYAPENSEELQSDDVDLGSTAPAALPRENNSKTPLMLVQGGKDGVLRLLDRSNLRGVGSELQRVDIGSALYSTPAVWQDPSSHQTWIYFGLSDGVRAYRIVTSQGVSRLVHAWTSGEGETQEGTSPVVSGGVVFVAMNGAMFGLDAHSGKRLWSGSIGNVHWESPIVANNAVFCSDENGMLSAFSL
jgi:outer membrane protein assembly factor BamB